MNRKFLTIAAFAAMCVFATTSCSNEDEITDASAIESVNDADVSGEITLALNSGGDGTRAARPVYSSAAANNVTEVKLRLFTKDSGTENYTEVTSTDDIFGLTNGVLSWTGPTDEGVPGTNDHEAEKVITLKGLTAGTTYKIVAYAYNNDHDSFSSVYEITESNGELTAGYSLDDQAKVEEVFMGEKTFTIGDNGKITDNNGSITVEMKRQVAGLLGYFYNIPIKKANADGNPTTVRYVRVYLGAESTGFTMSTSRKLTGTGTAVTTPGDPLLEYDLRDIIGADKYDKQVDDWDVNNPGTFEIPAKITDTDGYATVANSVLDGCFIMPYSSEFEFTSGNTITVGLYDEEDNALKEWKVNIDTGGTTYSIERNAFYSIGTKYATDSTTGDGDDNKDDDDPIDLSTENELYLILNDAWDVIYSMDLED